MVWSENSRGNGIIKKQSLRHIRFNKATKEPQLLQVGKKIVVIRLMFWLFKMVFTHSLYILKLNVLLHLDDFCTSTISLKCDSRANALCFFLYILCSQFLRGITLAGVFKKITEIKKSQSLLFYTRQMRNA